MNFLVVPTVGLRWQTCHIPGLDFAVAPHGDICPVIVVFVFHLALNVCFTHDEGIPGTLPHGWNDRKGTTCVREVVLCVFFFSS